MREENEGVRTISVASTRVPMILIRILVLFSMTCWLCSTRDVCRSGSEALTWSWEVYDGGFEDGSNLRSGWRSWGEGSQVVGGITNGGMRSPAVRQSNSEGQPQRKCPSVMR
jgi:hypothetical protein